MVEDFRISYSKIIFSDTNSFVVLTLLDDSWTICTGKRVRIACRAR